MLLFDACCPLLWEVRMARPAGLEPATLGLEDRCSNPTELRAQLAEADNVFG